MALSKPVPHEASWVVASGEHAPQGMALIAGTQCDWAWGWSTQSVCNWSDHWEQMQKSVVRIDVSSPLMELGGDLMDFSTAIGRRIATPLVELSEDFLGEAHWCASRTISSLEMQSGFVLASTISSLSSLEKQSGLILSSRKSRESRGCDKAVSWDLGDLVKEHPMLPFIIAGVLSPSPSGVLVLASAVPTLSLKVSCLIVGSSMLWKCWTIYARAAASGQPEERRQSNIAIAVTGTCGLLNLGLAYGGLPALLKLGGFSFHLAQYVARPELFLHYVADIVLNPLLLMDLANVTKIDRSDTSAGLVPSMIASAIGAGFNVGMSLAISPFACSVCAGGSLCCIVFQNFGLQSLLKGTERGLKIADAYLFSQSLYMIPTVISVSMHSKTSIVMIPFIDLIGKMGVIQLMQNARSQSAVAAQ